MFNIAPVSAPLIAVSGTFLILLSVKLRTSFGIDWFDNCASSMRLLQANWPEDTDERRMGLTRYSRKPEIPSGCKQGIGIHGSLLKKVRAPIAILKFVADVSIIIWELL